LGIGGPRGKRFAGASFPDEVGEGSGLQWKGTGETGFRWMMPRMHKGGLFLHKPDAANFYLVIPDEELHDHQAVPAQEPCRAGGYGPMGLFSLKD
jgi:hypothetical protein